MLSQELFFGITCFQFGFVLLQWYIFRRKEYIYYLLYILTIIGYFILLYLSNEDHYIYVGNKAFNILYVEKSISFLAYGFYMCFGQLFLRLPELFPRLNRFIKLIETIIFSYCFINFCSLIITSNFIIHAKIYSILFTIIFIFSVCSVSYFLYFQKDILSRIPVVASVCISIGTFASMLAGWHNKDPLLANPEHMLFLQLGVLIELFILNSGLVYKIKLIQNDVLAAQQMVSKELEENKKLNHQLIHIREEISMDLHDEMGSGLSTIRLITELIKRRTINGNKDKQLNKISESSKELVQKINEIVWALNAGNDSLENLIMYLREYTMNFFDNTDIDCHFEFQDKMPEMLVAGHNRRSIFLIVKEALNNIVKHAQASKVNVQLSINKNLEIKVHDNGKGFKYPSNNFSRNGLQNMKRRTNTLHGSLQFINKDGTTVILSVPVNNLSHESAI